ncbi:NB-ARC domain-containing protein [Streptomyces hokutonensis]|uniref:NB-ARC domain-containing protein n=1 Tax=Streptomyces hokutonensis TaxID=1306990 RepID=UPI0036CC9C9A
MSLAGAGAVLAVGLALAGNAATSAGRWPGRLDELRQDPWPWTGALAGLALVAAVAAVWIQERVPAVADDPPPPPPAAVPGWFVDREQTRATVRAVCRYRRAVGITTSLWGAGGFGKTTMATAVCADRSVRRRFRQRIYPVTIGRDVRGRAAIAAKLAEVTRFITGDTTEFDDPDLAGAHLGRLLDTRPRTLLLLDDVWEREQLTPFLHGGRRCVRLVTTRNPDLLPPDADRIQVDEMSPRQARAVLAWGLPSLPDAVVEDLIRTTGRWALLLRLTNRLIAEQTATGADPAVTAAQVLHRLREFGPAAVDDPAAAWDLDDPRLRSRAVKASIEAATTLLPPGGADRFTELGIFAEDELIPLPIVALLWQATAGLAEDQTRLLCRDLERLSLITLDSSHGGRISLHDVIRDYLRAELQPSGLVRLNGLLIDRIAATLPPAGPLAPTHPDPARAWWRIEHGYLLDHLVSHLIAADRTALAEAVAGDVRWAETRLAQRGPSAPWSDLTHINTPHTHSLARPLAQAAHLLTPTTPPHFLIGVLHSCLDAHPHWHAQITARQRDPALRPCLINRWPLPGAPHHTLQRTLTGHFNRVRSVAIAPDGSWLASAGDDRTVRIWDRTTGTCTATLTGHAYRVESVAIAPDGSWLASAGDDRTVRIWDRTTGTCTATLTGHFNEVRSVAIAPDGSWLATASNDESVRIWDRTTGTCTATLTGHFNPVRSVAIAPDGSWLATAGDDTVRIWDRATATWTATLTGHTSWVQSVAIAPDGSWLATASTDETVRIWDRATATCTATLTGHTSLVRSVAIAPDGSWLATASTDRTVRIWDRTTGTCTATLTGHFNEVRSVAIAPDGSWLATAGDDGGRIWDRTTGTCTATLTGHTSLVRSVAIAPDGSWLATASFDETVRIWDQTTGTCTATLTGHTGSVESVAIAPDGSWLATASTDRTVRIWDSAGRQTVAIARAEGDVQSCAWGQDNDLAAAGERGLYLFGLLV